MKTKFTLIVSILGALLLSAPSVLSQSYSVVDLGASLGTNSYAYGINNQSEVVGYWLTTTGIRAFLYSAGSMTDLGSLGGTNQYALNINGAGQVVGFADTASGTRAFLFSNGSMTNLGSLGGLNSYAYGINDGGEIVGYVDTTNGCRAYIYGGNAVTNLGTLGGSNSFSFGVNASSLVVGASSMAGEVTNAFLWQGGFMTNLNDLLPTNSGWELTDARGINNSGEIVGSGFTGGQEQAFLFSGGQVTGLGLLPETTNSFAFGINNLNQVVGAGTLSNGISQAFLWAGGSLSNLNSFLPPGSGWDLREARGINDYSQIVGWGVISNEEHAFILSPNFAPIITSQPQSQTVTVSSNAVFTVGVVGTPPLTYQWLKNGVAISGATSSSLAITNAQSANAAIYSVVISNSIGSVTSAEATLDLVSYDTFYETFEAGLGNWTTVSGSSALTNSTAQNHTSGGTNSAHVGSSANRMYHNLPETAGHVKATFWIYDSSQTRAYGEVRSYTGAGYGQGSLTQILAIGKYNSVNMPGETWNSLYYQGRVYAGTSNGWFNLNAAGAPTRSSGWHKFEIERLDDGTTIKFYVDGILSRTITGATYDTWDSVTIGSVGSGTSSGDAWFDDIKIEHLDAPILVTQPQSQSVIVGNSATFSVSATGAPLTCQWRHNGINIPGATNTVLTIPSAQDSDAGSYCAVVSNGYGPVISGAATLTVLDPPSIVIQPVSQTNVHGATVTFNVVATGAAPLYYQWQKNGTNLTDGGNVSGSWSTSLTLAAVSTNDAGTYSVVVTNMAGSATSQPAVLSVQGTVIFYDSFENGLGAWTNTPPTGTALVLSSGEVTAVSGTMTACMTNSLNKMYHGLGAEVSGRAGATFWIYDDSGSQTRSFGEVRAYSVNNLQPENLQQVLAIGNYRVPFDSHTGILTNETVDAIRYQGRVLTGTNTGWFNLNGPGAPTRSTGWHKFQIVQAGDGSTIHFYIDDTLSRTINNATAATWDTVEIGSYGSGSGMIGNAWFDDVKVEYLTQVITTQPVAQTANQGSSVTFNVVATGTQLSYQWKKDGVNIPGATSSSLTLPNVQSTDEADYSVWVTTPTDSEPSALARLSVVSLFAITQQPQSQTVSAGSTVTFNVGASGSNPNYQWQKNGANIAGATTSSLTLRDVLPADQGSYSVIISNAGYSISSQGANLTVTTVDRLGYWRFDSTNWIDEQGQVPLFYTNLQSVLSWSGQAVQVSNSNPAQLIYRDVEANNAPNIDCWNGTVRFWIKTGWASGTGPQTDAGLIEFGNRSNDSWGLIINSDGRQLRFQTGTNGVFMTNVTASFATVTNQWHQIVLTYTPTNSTLYVDGKAMGTNGAGVIYCPSLSVRANGFSVGSDMSGLSQCGSSIDELETFDYPLDADSIAQNYQQIMAIDSDSDGLPDVAENQFGTDPHSWDTDGDGLSDLYEAASGLNPLVWNDPLADSDYDGRNDMQEQREGTNPTDPGSMNCVRLGYWQFNDTNWLGQQGQKPLFFTNVQSVASFNGNAALFDNASASSLIYRDVETNGCANINCRNGTIQFWFKPNWSSSTTNNGSGPQSEARFIEMGQSGMTNDLWALLINSDGSEIRLETQTNGMGVTNFTAPVAWASNVWHEIIVTFSPSNSTLYLDGQAVTNGSGVCYPRLSVRNNGFSVGSDMTGQNQVRGMIDELQTFNYVISAHDIRMDYELYYWRDSDQDGLPDLIENQLGTNPLNPDTSGDGMTDGYKVAHGMNPLVWNNPHADSDYDGRTDLQEQFDGTDPHDPNSVAQVQLGYWRFNDTNWLGEQGQMPLIATNLQSVLSWSGNAMQINNSTAMLIYRDVETNGSANINCRNGSLRFWFKPAWFSGVGPQTDAGLIEMGTRDGDDRWALLVNNDGTEIRLVTQTNGIGMTNVAANILWNSNEWHQVVLTFSPSNSALYFDGQAFETNGAGTIYYPRLSVRANGFSVGSDMTGLNQANGTFDELETFNFTLASQDIASNYWAIMSIDSDSDGVPDVIENQYGTDPNNPDTDGDGYTDYQEIYIFGSDPLTPNSGPPPLPSASTNVRLNFWRFDDTNWLSGLGYQPRDFTNLVSVASWSSNALSIDSTNPAFLRYNVIENDGHTNIAVRNGSIGFWFQPNWSSASSGGDGPGNYARLLEIGKWTTNGGYGCFSMYFDPSGTNIYSETQNHFSGGVILQAPVDWVSGDWHQVVLTYTVSNSVLYLDGEAAASGPGIVRWPSQAVQMQDGMCIGSDQTGTLQARGQFENMWAYNYPLTGDSIQLTYLAGLSQMGSGSAQMNQSQFNGMMQGFFADFGLPDQPSPGPTDSQSQLTLQIGPGTSSNTLTLTLLGTYANRTYQLYSRNAFSSGSTWSPDRTVTGTGSQTSITITNSGTSKFYTVNEFPQIATQPVSQTVTAGANATFSAVATGTAPLTYQWRFNGANISGATSTNYTLLNVQSNNAGSYSIVVSNIAGNVVSSNAILTVNVAPSITTQPVSQTVNLGSSATFSVAANGTAPLLYQWRFNGTNLTGATSLNYTCGNVQFTNAGSYSVVVSNVAGSVTSSAAVLIVYGAPSISTQPASQTVNQGLTATFSVAAGGTTPLSYQWMINGAAISGATASSYAKSNVLPGDAGSYSVLVSNIVGTVTSDNAILTVNASPTITTQPVGQTVNQGANVSFSVIAGGTAPLSYQWKFNGGNISGATTSVYSKSNVQSNDAGSYSVVVTNIAGSVTSANAVLGVNVPPSITTQPTSQTVNQGSGVTFSVTAGGTSPLSYQWRLNGANISNGTASSYTCSSVQPGNAGSYLVIVTNMAGSVTSSTATLTVNGPPSITVQPQSQTVALGSTVFFSVAASGTPPLTYSWSRNGVALTNSDRVIGADTSALSVSGLLSGDAGSYSVSITGPGGQTNSSNAVLTVNGSALLGRWHFDTNTWVGEQGQIPLVRSNLASVTGCSNQAVSIDTNVVALLSYRDVETNGNANICCWQGSVRFYFAPDWDSGAGPGNEGRFFELGTRDTTNGWWALVANTNGTQINFVTQTNGSGTINLSAPINLLAKQWHQIVLAYSSSNSALYIDGTGVVTNGAGVTFWPRSSVRTNGFRIGSDTTGLLQIDGALDELETFNYPLSASDISAGYLNSGIVDSDADGLPDSIDPNPNNPASKGDGISDYFDWLHSITTTNPVPVLPNTVPCCPIQ